MEHSALHALELTGQIIALGGVFFILGLVFPAIRKLGPDTADFGNLLSISAAKWVFRGAMMGAIATFLDLFVQVAEVKGRTVFDGVDFSLLTLFATGTTVGKLCLWRIGALLLTAALARIRGNLKWRLAGASALCAVVLTSSVSHAAAQPEGRISVMAAQVAHIATAALWVGVLIHLLAARKWIESRDDSKDIKFVAEIVRRFSPVALAVTSLLALTGVFMVWRFLGPVGGVLTSAYGLTLIIKLLLLCVALYAGYVNFKFIRPALLNMAGAGETKSLLQRFGKTLELEVTAGVLVVTVAGILASVSPPGESGSYRLTPEQARAMLSPRLPAATFADPEKFYGLAVRTDDDLRFSEFMHHWSGAMVILLGVGWLLQSIGGKAGKWAGYGWPLLMIPFAIFVGAMADPEVWLLRKVSLRQAIGDPQLLEHQLGAAMILVLVWLGWRDHKKPEARRPLGYALPVIMILGGLLLLGHAHSTLTITEAVTNLINVQHAVFGAFILAGGAIRWMSLRELVPQRGANILWPCMIIGLGLFMTFCYREIV